MKYVSVDEIKKRSKDVVLKNGALHRCFDPTELAELPTIEPKRGRWITKKDACGIDYQICSNCETEIQWRDRHGVILRVDMQNAPYCPNCGAKMERSEDGET